MTKKRYLSILMFNLKIGGMYLLAEGIIHVSGVRTTSMSGLVSDPMIAFIHIFTRLWGLSAFFFSWLLYHIVSDFKNTAWLLDGLAVISFFAGVFALMIVPHSLEHTLLPRMVVWLPMYSQLVLVEAAALFFNTALILYGKYKKYL